MELERRYFAIDDVRVAADARSVEGYAAVFNSNSENLGGFIERINPGAFSRSLSSSSNIHAYWNHDSNFVIGSTRSGKLALAEDSKGLTFKLNPVRLTDGQLDAIRDGDMKMSFGFRVAPEGDAWDLKPEVALRTLLDVDLFEVSPVSRPAYLDTSAAVRALEDAKRSMATDTKLINRMGYHYRKAQLDQRTRGI